MTSGVSSIKKCGDDSDNASHTYPHSMAGTH